MVYIFYELSCLQIKFIKSKKEFINYKLQTIANISGGFNFSFGGF